MKTYIVVHVDRGHNVEAWFPDFPGLTVPGDRLADTTLSVPLVLWRHVEQFRQDGLAVPEPTTPTSGPFTIGNRRRLWASPRSRPTRLVEIAVALVDKRVTASPLP